jgi:HK97 family phage major capsid protein
MWAGPAEVRLNRLREERALEVERMREVHVAAGSTRGLTPEEQRAWDGAERRVAELDAQIVRLEQAAREERAERERTSTGREIVVTDGPAEERSEAFLGREQRMLSWLHERGELSRRDAGYEPREFDLGRVVQAMLTGRRDRLTDTEERVLSIGTDAQGGYLLPAPLAAQVIDLARNQARVLEAGASTVPMSSDKLSVPRIVADPTAAWKAENAAVTESDFTFDRVTLDAQTVHVKIRMSRERSSPAASGTSRERNRGRRHGGPPPQRGRGRRAPRRAGGLGARGDPRGSDPARLPRPL